MWVHPLLFQVKIIFTKNTDTQKCHHAHKVLPFDFLLPVVSDINDQFLHLVYSIMATTLAGPADPPLIFRGKQATLKPV